MQPDKPLAKRTAAAEIEQIVKELRAKTRGAHGNEKTAIDQVAPIFCPPEGTPQEFDEELRTLLRRLKRTQKGSS